MTYHHKTSYNLGVVFSWEFVTAVHCVVHWRAGYAVSHSNTATVAFPPHDMTNSHQDGDLTKMAM